MGPPWFGLIQAMLLTFTGASGEIQVLLHGITVSEVTLQNSTRNEVYPSPSDTVCAMRASDRPWSHLMCHVEGQCHFHDLNLSSRHDEGNGGIPVQQCFTILGEVCIINNNEIHEKGQEIVIDCVLSACDGLTFKPKSSEPTDKTCPANFVYAPAAGCISIYHTLINFAAGTSYCAAMNSRLVIPEDFEVFRIYFHCQHPADMTWIGVKGTTWQDGSTVSSSEWIPGGPDPVNADCGIMRPGIEHYVDHRPCNWNLKVVCQLLV